MLRWLVTFFTVFLLLSTWTRSQVINAMDLSHYQWENRLLLMFTQAAHNVEYQQQLAEFEGHTSGFKERDLKLFHLIGDGSAHIADQRISKAEVKRLAGEYKINPAGFTILLIGKDGTEKLRQPTVLKTTKLFDVIDAMPMRRREMKQQ